MSLRVRRLGAALAVTAAAALAAPLGASAASTYTEHVAALARQGIARAVKAGWVKPADAKRYRADVYLALRGIRFLPKLRGQRPRRPARRDVDALGLVHGAARARALLAAPGERRAT